ncbi:unnamed protein product [Aphanomyces euteiches]|nr:hypothetical protein Ae201684P_017913 [Aphanomyces euteiches]
MGVANWACEEVLAWLNRAGFVKYEEVFRENDISGDILLTLTNDILRDDLKIAAYGHRVRLLQAIAKLVDEDASNANIQHLTPITDHQSLHQPMARNEPPSIIVPHSEPSRNPTELSPPLPVSFLPCEFSSVLGVSP